MAKNISAISAATADSGLSRPPFAQRGCRYSTQLAAIRLSWSNQRSSRPSASRHVRTFAFFLSSFPQLARLLAAMDHPIARDQHSYEELFCQGHFREQGGRQRWQTTGASRLDELRRLTRPLVLHRRKQQVLDLPPKQRRFEGIDLDAEEVKGFDYRLRLVIDDYRQRVAEGLVRSDAESLAVLTALRQIAKSFTISSLAAVANTKQNKKQQSFVCSSPSAQRSVSGSHVAPISTTHRPPFASEARPM